MLTKAILSKLANSCKDSSSGQKKKKMPRRRVKCKPWNLQISEMICGEKLGRLVLSLAFGQHWLYSRSSWFYHIAETQEDDDQAQQDVGIHFDHVRSQSWCLLSSCQKRTNKDKKNRLQSWGHRIARWRQTSTLWSHFVWNCQTGDIFDALSEQKSTWIFFKED